MPARARADACPGVFTPHDAADGALARVRLPGGRVTAAQLRVLAGCAEDLGDGRVHLTSRGSVQLRGLDRADPRLAERLTACGLLPSPTHERARNVLASPLSGIAGGLADVRGLAGALDRGLCARPALAELPGRFLFALDDGRGDVAAEEPDLCWRAVSADSGALLVAGTDTGLAVHIDDAVTVLLDAAQAFLDVRGTAWRAVELPDAPRHIAAALRGSCVKNTVPARIFTHDPYLVVAPVLGEMTAGQVRVLAQAAPEAVVTPWRTVVLPDPALPVERLVEAGFVVDPGSPAAGVSACAGRPGCAKALADVRGDVREALAAGRVPAGRRVHVVGCARRCGAPRGPHSEAVAVEGGGYLVDGVRHDDLVLLPVPAVAQ